MFTDFADDGPMWTGSGDRETRHIVTFAAMFLEPPVVQVGLSMWDTDHQTNARLDLATECVSETGFHLVFKTWGDTRVARVRASWTAIGPVRGEDDWDVG